MTAFDASSVRLRPFTPSDIDLMCDYWYRSPTDFLRSLQLNPEKMLSEAELRERWRRHMDPMVRDRDRNAFGLVIEHQGMPVGCHTISDLQYGRDAIFHAHLWRPELRQKGLGSHTYPRACDYFMKRFALQKILFHTPTSNPGPNRLKRKLGLQPLDEIAMTAPFMAEGARAFVYEITPIQVENLLRTGHV